MAKEFEINDILNAVDNIFKIKEKKIVSYKQKMILLIKMMF